MSDSGTDVGRWEAEAKYEKLRVAARLDAQTVFRALLQKQLKFRPIDTVALRAVGTQWAPRRRVTWDWGAQLVYWRRKRPTRWDLAVWHRRNLVCLALGHASRNAKKILYLRGMERAPGKYRLSQAVMPMIIVATEAYARQLRAQFVYVIDPLAQLEDRYLKLGYTYRYDPICRCKVAVKEL